MTKTFVSALVAASTLWSMGALGGELNDTTYDYVIVGGGTSGLTVANRLTEGGKRTYPLHLFPYPYLSSKTWKQRSQPHSLIRYRPGYRIRPPKQRPIHPPPF
jgi:hypothetical protein